MSDELKILTTEKRDYVAIQVPEKAIVVDEISTPIVIESPRTEVITTNDDIIVVERVPEVSIVVVGTQGPAGADGEDGDDGAPGAQGDPGPGVAAGGTAGQLLAKVDGTDYNTEWIDPDTVGVTDHGLLSGLADDDHPQYHTDARALAWLGTRSTSDLPEGTNLYFTNERVDDRVDTLIQDGTGITWAYDDVANTLTPTISLSPFSTTNLAEGSNLYYTDERVDDRVAALLVEGAGIDLAYVDGSGTLTITADLSELSTTTLPEGTNLYFTDERAQDAVGGILVDGSTVNFTYNDGAPSITAEVIQSALDHGSISGLSDNDHPQYLLVADIDDTPVNGETAQPISSNWAFDHVAAADPHTQYLLESAYTAADVLAKLLTVDGSGSGLDADLFDGLNSDRFIYGDNSTGATRISDSTNITKSGFYYVTSAGGPAGIPTSDHAVIHTSFDGDTTYAHQIAFDYVADSGGPWVRWKEASVWSTWRKLWHEANDGSGSGLDADLLDGKNTGTSGNTIPLLDGVNTWSGVQTYTATPEFGNGLNARKSTSGEFYALTLANNSGANGSSCVIDMDATGAGQDVRSAQIAVVNDSGSTGYYFVIRTGAGEPGVDRLKIFDTGEVTISGSTVWHAGNDGSGSGLDADSVDGIDSTRIVYGDNSTASTSIADANNIVKSGFYYVTTSNTPAGTGDVAIINETPSPDSTYGHQIALDFSADAGPWVRWKTAGSFSSWRKIWHEGNDGSGSGLDADLLDGKNIGTSGNTIPLLDGNNTYSGTATFTNVVATNAGISNSHTSNGVTSTLSDQTANPFSGWGTHASFNNNVYAASANRAASTAYSFFLATSDVDGTPDTEFNLQGNGTALADGSFTGSGADYQEYFESTDGDALPVGAVVVLDGGKVRVFRDGDPVEAIMGVVRPKEDNKNSAVVGNAAWNHWTDKYLTDDYGRYLHEEYEVYEWEEEGRIHSYASYKLPAGLVIPKNAKVTTQTRRKLNPAWSDSACSKQNPIGSYTPRHDRDEWNLIGLLGQVQIEHGQPVNPRWIKMKTISATVDLWFIR